MYIFLFEGTVRLRCVRSLAPPPFRRCWWCCLSPRSAALGKPSLQLRRDSAICDKESVGAFQFQ